MIVNRQRRVRVPIQTLNEFLHEVCEILKQPDEALTVCLVSDGEIARWNHAYRGKNGPTDVLSFPANGSEKKQGKKRSSRRKKSERSTRRMTQAVTGEDYLGDIAIAPAVARRNASRLGRSFNDEMRILILHGILHLMGYDHETDTGQMDRREQRLRRALGLA
jgi:probable rRNA maturation factor